MDFDLQKRMKIINQMLFEMASGNFFFRIERSTENDDIEALIVTLNMLAEEINEVMLHQGYANLDGIVLDVVQMSFLLDHSGNVIMCNQQSCAILLRLYDDIIGTPFSNLLVKSSQLKWEKTWNSIKKKDFLDTSIELKFKSRNDLVLQKEAYLTKFQDDDGKSSKILVTCIHRSTTQKELDKNLKQKVISNHQLDLESQSQLPKPKIRLNFEDIRKIREGHDILMNNLEKDFPPLKEFALQIGTNEFKLKYGFKELYGTTVHKFLMMERLRKAQMLIQYSDLPIKSIAFMTGFKSVPHFSRTFKKRYEYSPSFLRKNSITKE